MTILQRKLSFLKNYKLYCCPMSVKAPTCMEMCRLSPVKKFSCPSHWLFHLFQIFLQPPVPTPAVQSSMCISVPGPGNEPMPPAVKMHRLNHWTTWEVPSNCLSVSFSDRNKLDVFSNLSSEHGNMSWSLNRKTHHFSVSLVTY